MPTERIAAGTPVPHDRSNLRLHQRERLLCLAFLTTIWMIRLGGALVFACYDNLAVVDRLEQPKPAPAGD